MGYNEEIAVLRTQINDIDKQMVRLFEQRMSHVSEVAMTKKRHDIAVLDASRESAVIDRALERLENNSLREETKQFFHAMMDISKKRQQADMGIPMPTPDYFADKPSARVGYLGIPGSYSFIAAKEATQPDAQLTQYSSFTAIFEGIKTGDIDYAMLPAENTETGSITSVVDLLAKYGYYIVGEKLLPITHSLLVLPGAKLKDIRKVYSHPEALSQCSAFFDAHPHIEAHPSLSTAQAAAMIAQNGDKTHACIGSSQAAQIYGLETKREGIQNNKGNCTRFVIVARAPYQSDACDKTSVVLMLAHKPGALYEMLGVFADGGINILKLESRPLKDRPFEYLFHIDFAGSAYDAQVSQTIEIMKGKAAGYTYLGCYPRDKITI